ncbi:putative conserved membrane protein [Bartonella ancashensis]|uniref:Putative conserved membrane protein n=2 Tax=Bartonella ancashensis TaxID=1318743 RepID=A0A0M4LIN6_9HYPH|nr:putative conserved membrane protein [Bartonella ancashensis]
MSLCLLQARLIASTLMAGWHGRRKCGSGENFWQFRPYVEGEPITRIDWRRSARDKHIYLREYEWETAQTIWIWPDQSASMHYCSRFSKISKGNHALILSLALATLLTRSGEHVAIPDLMPPTMISNIAEHMALALIHYKGESPLPNFSAITNSSQIIIISDFLDPIETIIENLKLLTMKKVNAYLIETSDPAEEYFPFTGRTEFIDPETKEKTIFGKAENLSKSYCKLYQERRQKLMHFCSRQGWTYQVSKTDQPLTETIRQLAYQVSIPSPHTRKVQ